MSEAAADEEGEIGMFDNGALGSAGWTPVGVDAVDGVATTGSETDVELDVTRPDTVGEPDTLVAAGAVVDAAQQASLPSSFIRHVSPMSSK